MMTKRTFQLCRKEDISTLGLHRHTSELIISFPHIIYSHTLQAYPNTKQPSKQTWLVICGEGT